MKDGVLVMKEEAQPVAAQPIAQPKQEQELPAFDEEEYNRAVYVEQQRREAERQAMIQAQIQAQEQAQQAQTQEPNVTQIYIRLEEGEEMYAKIPIKAVEMFINSLAVAINEKKIIQIDNRIVNGGKIIYYEF